MNQILLSHVVAVGAGGAAGSILRFLMANWVNAHWGSGFPVGTLVVNALGCLLIGILVVVLVERAELDPLWDPLWRLGLMVGVLGGFTTFSAFSLETLQLFEQGARLKALLNVTLSIIVCLTAAWCGMRIARIFSCLT